jgi:hypothetical protein
MSDGKKQGDENWRKFTADDLTAALNGKPTRIRYRDKESQEWETGTEKYIQEMCKRSLCRDVIEVLPWLKFSCEVYVEPAPTCSPKDGCRMLEDNEEPMPGDFINWGAGWNELTAAMFPFALIPSWYCRPIKATVESGPPSSIGLTYDPWTDTVSRVVRTDASGKVVEEIENVGPVTIEAFSPVTVETKPDPEQHRTPKLADLADGPVDPLRVYVASVKQERRDALMASIAACPVPKGFRLLGDEPRLASDGYWSLSCKDWLVIGDRIEIANRDKWPAIRLVVDEPEPVKQFVIVNDQDGNQTLYIDGVLHDGDNTVYGCDIDQAAKGCAIRIESRDVGWDEDDWPRRLDDFGAQAKHADQDPASVFGSDPIEVRPIMQIRLPVPASVLGKLGDMLEKHYPGSTMRQVGGYLVFEEPSDA